MTYGNGPPAGEPRQHQPVPPGHRAASWLVWWVLLMGLWTAVDDSVGLAELGAGAAAALGALLAEVAGYQAERPRAELRLEPMLRQPVDGLRREVDGDSLSVQPPPGVLHRARNTS